MRLAICLCLVLSVCACAATPTNPEPPPEAVESPPATTGDGVVAEAAPKRMLEGCEQSATNAGLKLKCAGFVAMLSRMTSEEAITDAVLAKTESDMFAGFSKSVKGEVRPRELAATTAEGDIPLTAFDVVVDGKHRLTGAILVLPAGDKEVLSVTCLAPDNPDGTTCSAVMSEVVTEGLPPL